jgi:hypothetical protein
MTDADCDAVTESLDLDTLAQIIEIASTGKLSGVDGIEKK